MARNGYLDKRKNQLRRAAASAATQATDLTRWLCIVALADEFGFGAKRCERFIKRLEKVAEAHDTECKDDYDLAVEHLRRRLEQILQCKVTRTD